MPYINAQSLGFLRIEDTIRVIFSREGVVYVDLNEVYNDRISFIAYCESFLYRCQTMNLMYGNTLYFMLDNVCFDEYETN